MTVLLGHYESTIHCNANLTDIQKFTYLKSQLEGAAACVIEEFAITNANYARATDLLKQRFGKQGELRMPLCKPC